MPPPSPTRLPAFAVPAPPFGMRAKQPVAFHRTPAAQ